MLNAKIWFYLWLKIWHIHSLLPDWKYKIGLFMQKMWFLLPDFPGETIGLNWNHIFEYYD